MRQSDSVAPYDLIVRNCVSFAGFSGRGCREEAQLKSCRWLCSGIPEDLVIFCMALSWLEPFLYRLTGHQRVDLGRDHRIVRNPAAATRPPHSDRLILTADVRDLGMDHNSAILTKLRLAQRLCRYRQFDRKSECLIRLLGMSKGQNYEQ